MKNGKKQKKIGRSAFSFPMCMHGNCIVLNNKVPVTYIYMINHSDSVLFATQTRTKPQLYERRQKLLKKLRPQKHWISFPRFEKKV